MHCFAWAKYFNFQTQSVKMFVILLAMTSWQKLDNWIVVGLLVCWFVVVCCCHFVVVVFGCFWILLLLLLLLRPKN